MSSPKTSRTTRIQPGWMGRRPGEWPPGAVSESACSDGTQVRGPAARARARSHDRPWHRAVERPVPRGTRSPAPAGPLRSARAGRGCAWHPSTSAPAARPAHARHLEARPDDRPVHALGARRPPRGPPPARRDLPPDLDRRHRRDREEGTVGRTILWNLLSSPFGGTVYPVNPTRPAILGVKAYPSIAAIGEPVDLAVIVTPAKSAPQLVIDCGEAGVKGGSSSSAGFKEVGAEGVELERQVLEAARPVRDPRRRAELPRRHEPDRPDERHVRGRHRATRDGSASSASRARCSPRSSTGRRARTSASARSSPWARCSTSAGATSSTTWATTRTPTRSSSTWRPSATRGRSCRPRARSR